MPAKSPFYERLEQAVLACGGLYNAHAHLDRAGTLDAGYLHGSDLAILENSFVSLKKKHSLIHNLHAGPAFHADDLQRRARFYLDQMVAVGTRRVDTMVDVTSDNVGLSALETLEAIREEYRGRIDLRLGAYTPFGFRDDEPERWDLLVEGAERADFIGCLPEADDIEDYPDNIGFEAHCARHLELAQRLGKLLHVHTDQRNQASERGTERLIAVAREHGTPKSSDGDPMVWAVHMVSPSTYDDARHQRLARDLVETNIGVITCPSAAIGMRQLRPLQSPTYNCIPRILELLVAGVHVRVGTDNIADICSPSTTADLYDELFVLSAAIRYYQIDILAKLGAGLRLDAVDRQVLADHLEKNEREIQKVLRATDAVAAE